VARLFTDENFTVSIAEKLRQLGHDVLTIQETGKASEAVSDHENLAFAVSEQRAVLTYNRKDFIKLHRRDSDHFGIIVCTVDENWDALTARIHEALSAHSDLRGQLVRINRPQS
jgi:uncharacterized protein with PIN domain